MIDVTLRKRLDVPLYVQLGDEVCRAILEGQALPLEQLPTERELARQLGVNRLTVGRGYEALRDRGILFQRQGRGTFVSANAYEVLGVPARRRIREVGFVAGADSLSSASPSHRVTLLGLLDGIHDAFAGRHVKVRMISGRGIESRDLEALDAVIALEVGAVDCDLAVEARRRDMPAVHVWARLPHPGIPWVTFDRYEAVRLVCEHLIACGYQRIGFIGRVPQRGGNPPPKYPAFVSALHRGGLDIRARDVIDIGDQSGGVYSAMRALARGADLPEAFFVDTDETAMQVIPILREYGISTPDDVGIAAFDDWDESATFDPPLTTVRTPRRGIGRRAAEMLLDWPEDGDVPERTLVEPSLKIRASARAVRNDG